MVHAGYVSALLQQGSDAFEFTVDRLARGGRSRESIEIDATRAEDVRAIKKLQRAYGYYADRGLWNELADLFTDDAVADYPSGIFDGNASIRAMFIQNLDVVPK